MLEGYIMKQYTEEDLDKLDKDVIITLFLAQQGHLDEISRQLDFLTEQIALMNQRAFGRKSDKNTPGQLSLEDVLNEAEAYSDDSPEPVYDEIIVRSHSRRSKAKGKRDTDLEKLPARIINHTIPEDELRELFPDGYKELPERVYKRLAVIPQTFLCDEHHVHQYVSIKDDGKIVRAPRPGDIFRNSIATPSIMALLYSGKYEQHQPVERLSGSFKANGVDLETNTLCNWIIKGSEYYLSLIYDELHKQLYDSRVVHADETPVRVIRDGRDSNAKSYMWVYCNNPGIEKNPIILYDYQKTRKADHPRDFLSRYSGIVVTDGYQVYHTIDNEREDLTVAGCWIHAKRGFSEIIKSLGETGSKGTIAKEAADRISMIFHLDNQLDGLSATERKRRRNIDIKPKVNDFFAWAKKHIDTGDVRGQTAKALQYCLNQEKYLRVFLKDGHVPMDNNTAERAIRPFTLGRKNWVNIDSINGANASAIAYSIVETALANHINVYDYFEYLFSKMPDHLDDSDRSFITDLLPWSPEVIKHCKRQSK